MFIQQRLTNYAEHYNTGGGGQTDRQTDIYIDKDIEIKNRQGETQIHRDTQSRDRFSK